MTAGIQFTSYVQSAQRAALEALVFFNSRQERVLRGIVNAIEKFGPPEIVDEGDRLRVRVDGVTEVQSLFAVDAASGTPVGIAIYVRSDLERITVLHLGIAEAFTIEGPRGHEHLLLRLIGELRRCCRRLKGVRQLELYYLSDRSGDRGSVVPHRMPV